MDHHATLGIPIRVVFARLADPARLGDWLPQVVEVRSDSSRLVGLGYPFTVTVHGFSGEQAVDAEIAAYEPPWLVGYRLRPASPIVIRATCTVQGAGTRVQVHQSDAADALLVDLARLARALGGPEDSRPRAPIRDQSGVDSRR